MDTTTVNCVSKNNSDQYCRIRRCDLDSKDFENFCYKKKFDLHDLIRQDKAKLISKKCCLWFIAKKTLRIELRLLTNRNI